MVEELRIKLSVNLFVELRCSIELEKDDNSWRFLEPVPELDIRQGDHLIALHWKNKLLDVRKLSRLEFDPILSQALESEGYLVMRIIRGDHEKSDKFLAIKQVRHFHCL